MKKMMVQHIYIHMLIKVNLSRQVTFDVYCLITRSTSSIIKKYRRCHLLFVYSSLQQKLESMKSCLMMVHNTEKLTGYTMPPNINLI